MQEEQNNEQPKPPKQENVAVGGQVTAIPNPEGVAQTAQTANSGTPVQIEAVQYKKPPESKVGLYTRITAAGLWFSVIFLSIFGVSLVDKIGGSGGDLGSATVLTFSIAVITVPIFLIANSKRSKEMSANPALVDDLFYKKSVRSNLTVAIFFTAISAVGTIYILLSKLFLSNSSTSFNAFFSSLVWTIGFGAALAFFWQLHAKTRR